APILHVNGEEPMELFWAAQFALEFRQKFGRDVVIDVYCYRRQGHNETDQAAITQPHIYKQIQNRETIGQIYNNQHVTQGVLRSEQADGIEKEIWDKFEAGHANMLELQATGDRSVFSGSTAVEQVAYNHAPVPTGVTRDLLQHVGKVLTTVPEGFNL